MRRKNKFFQWQRKYVVTIGILFLICFVFLGISYFFSHREVVASLPQQSVPATVVSERTIEKIEDQYQTYVVQDLLVRIRVDGEERIVPITYDSNSLSRSPLLVGQQIIVTRTALSSDETTYYVADVFRIDRVLLILAGFFVFVFLAAGKKGIGSLLGLLVSIGVVLLYIIPQIQQGHDPVTVCVIGGIGIMVVSIFLAHGVSKPTTIAFFATALSFLAAYILAQVLVAFAMVHGLSTNEAFAIRELNPHIQNIKGLVIGGILIATIGALDDVTTAQSVAVFELAKADAESSVLSLIQKGMLIGREHVVSLINTLIIAYVGTSLIALLYYFQALSSEPMLLVVNRQFIAEEVVTTVAISSGLVLALPIVTVLAAVVVRKKVRLFI